VIRYTAIKKETQHSPSEVVMWTLLWAYIARAKYATPRKIL